MSQEQEDYDHFVTPEGVRIKIKPKALYPSRDEDKDHHAKKGGEADDDRSQSRTRCK